MRGVTAIYALVDPRTGTVKYVGQTTDTRRRLSHHINHPVSAAMAEWIADLKAAGKRPRLRVLERVAHEESSRAENRWMIEYRKTILNAAPAGGGRLHGKKPVEHHVVLIAHVEPALAREFTGACERLGIKPRAGLARALEAWVSANRSVTFGVPTEEADAEQVCEIA